MGSSWPTCRVPVRAGASSRPISWPFWQLAGHKDLTTTLGYMHLAKGETERAIRLLETPADELAGYRAPVDERSNDGAEQATATPHDNARRGYGNLTATQRLPELKLA